MSICLLIGAVKTGSFIRHRTQKMQIVFLLIKSYPHILLKLDSAVHRDEGSEGNSTRLPHRPGLSFDPSFFLYGAQIYRMEDTRLRQQVIIAKAEAQSQQESESWPSG